MMNPSISCKVNQFVGNAPRFGMIFLKDLNELSSHISSPPIISSYYYSFAIFYVYNLVKQLFCSLSCLFLNLRCRIFR